MPPEVDDYGALTRRRVGVPVHRIVASRFPAVQLFDVARDAEELQMLAELEGLTNDRLRQELGQIRLVADQDAVYGPGSTPIMAAFCHPAPSRFSDGSFGIYYAALSVDTAIAETKYHREVFLRDASISAETLEMRCYTTTLAQSMTELPVGRKLAGALLDPDSYSAGQRFGQAMRLRGIWGIYYASVRDRPSGKCVAVLRPRALRPVTQTSHYRYLWNGDRIHQIEPYQRFNVS